jgi:hypothetical protein
MDTKPQLTITGGISRKQAQDEHGNAFIEFEVDSFAGEEPGECAHCGEETDSGWLCLDGGEEYHDDCVVLVWTAQEENA